MSFYKIKILTLISFIVFSTTLESQIVDIETSRKEDLVGTKISLNLGFDGSSGTVDRTNYSIGTRFDFNNEVWNRFLIFNYSKREKDERINEDNIVDVVLIVRGGGSLQDLMAFNNEDLVRAISASEIPIITGIGHKPDVTLADYAADSAQETPTAAAIKSVPDCEVLKQDINYIEITLTTLSNNIISSLQNKLKSYLTILKIGRPIKVISNIANEFIQKRILLNKAINGKIRIYIEAIQNSRAVSYTHLTLPTKA